MAPDSPRHFVLDSSFHPAKVKASIAQNPAIRWWINSHHAYEKAHHFCRRTGPPHLDARRRDHLWLCLGALLVLMRARHKILLCLIPLYAFTWIGGYYSHSASLKREALQRYDAAKKSDAEHTALAIELVAAPPRPQARETGPVSGVAWCVPVLPGILVADSYYVIGPLYGRGGIKIVIFYGCGSWASDPLWGWIA